MTSRRSQDIRRLKRPVSLGLLLCALILVLASCTKVTDETYINAGSLLLQYELDSNYDEEYGRYWRSGADWLGLPSSEGKLDPDRMPDWAAEQGYAACVYWEDEYETETSVSQQGPDLIRIRRGRGWGWIILTKDLAFHVLETNLSWTITEDGVEVESVTRKFVDAWDAPAEET